MNTENKTNKKGAAFRSDKFKRGTMATIFTVIFVVIVVLLNLVFTVLTDRFPSMNMDISALKLNTLSEDAMNVAESVSEPVEIFLIGKESAYRGDDIYSTYGVQYSQVSNLADKMREANPLISVDYVDPDTSPDFVSQYSGDDLTTGKVLVRSEKRYRVLGVDDLFSVEQDQMTYQYIFYSKVDGALANAIHMVTLEEVPVIAVATGHEEVLDSASRAAFDSLMIASCFEVAEFNILTEDIPEAATVLMLPTPTTDYTLDEIAKINAFLSEEGRTGTRTLLVTAHPGQAEMPNLASLLEDWGMSIDTTAFVVETDTNSALSSGPQYIYANSTGTILTEEYPNLLAPYSAPIELIFSNNNGIATYSLIETNNTSYAVTNSTTEEELNNPETASYITAAMAQKVTAGNSTVKTNVVLVGNTMSFIDSFLSDTFSNKAYTADLMRYATDTSENDIGLSIAEVQTSQYDITATAFVCVAVGMGLFTILIPLAILIAGLVVFLKRRHL